MTVRLLPISPDHIGESLVAYLNERIEEIKPACDLDVSWAYIRAVIDDVRVISASREPNEIRIRYQIDYTAFCACKNLNARDSFTNQLTCQIRDGNIVLNKFVPQERSTFEEF
jgi:hypothetical protein